MQEEFVIYGIGNMGIAVASLLINNGYKIAYFLDKGISDSKLIDIGNNKIPAYHPEKKKISCYENYVLIAMSAAPIFEVKEYLTKIGFINIGNAGDVLCEKIPCISLANIWKMNENIYNSLSKNDWDDDLSYLHWKIACEWFYNRSEITAKVVNFKPNRTKFITITIEKLLKNCSVMIDSALLDGEYSNKFLEITNGTVYAFKLHPESALKYQNIKNIMIDDRELYSQSCVLTQKRLGIMKPFDINTENTFNAISLDEFVYHENINPDFIRIYTIGEALEILKGSPKTIIKSRPIVAVNIGHYLTDFVLIPYYWRLFFENYKLYFRVHSFQGNDCIMYCIPRERIELS